MEEVCARRNGAATCSTSGRGGPLVINRHAKSSSKGFKKERYAGVFCPAYPSPASQRVRPADYAMGPSHPDSSIRFQFLDMEHVKQNGRKLSWEADRSMVSPTRVQLNEDAHTSLSRSKTPQQLLLAVKTHLDIMTPYNLVYALSLTTAFKNDMCADTKKCIELLLDKVVDEHAKFNAKNTSRLIIQLADKAYQKEAPKVPLVAMLDQMQNDIFALEPKQLCKTLCALVGLKIQPTSQWCEEWCKVSLSKAPQISTADLCSCLWAIVRVGHRPSELWLDTWVHRTGDALTEMPKAELANLIDGLSRLQYQLTPDWLNAFLAATEAQAEVLTLSQLCIILSSLTAMNHTPPKHWIEAMLDRAIALLPQSRPHQDVILFSALAAWQHGPREEGMADMLRVISARLASYTPRQQVTLLSAVGRMNYVPSREWLDAYEAAAQPTVRRFSPALVVTIMITLARWRIPPGNAFMKDVLSVSNANMRDFTPDRLAQLLWALGQLQVSPHPRWLKAALDTFASRHEEASLMNYANFIFSLAKVLPVSLKGEACEASWVPPLTTLLRPLRRRLGELTPSQLHLTLMGLAGLRAAPGLVFLRLHAKAASRHVNAFTTVQKEQMATAYSSLMEASRATANPSIGNVGGSSADNTEEPL